MDIQWYREYKLSMKWIIYVLMEREDEVYMLFK